MLGFLRRGAVLGLTSRRKAACLFEALNSARRAGPRLLSSGCGPAWPLIDDPAQLLAGYTGEIVPKPLHELVLPGSVPVDERHLDLSGQLPSDVAADLSSTDAQTGEQREQLLVAEGGESVVRHRASVQIRGEVLALREQAEWMGISLIELKEIIDGVLQVPLDDRYGVMNAEQWAAAVAKYPELGR